jgi:hypothetical protein
VALHTRTSRTAELIISSIRPAVLATGEGCRTAVLHTNVERVLDSSAEYSRAYDIIVEEANMAR